jgi:5-methylcytosine-specific restriction endonuclease McrA
MKNKGQFVKGQHWRKPQPFREKEWLEEHYIRLGMSTGEIAGIFGVTDCAILFWMRRHGIQRRTVSESRKLKHWGSVGADNPMWNRKGELNPNWKGGITTDRQAFYASQEWKDACSFVWNREKATCQRCFLLHDESPDMPFHIHHIVPFSDKELRADPTNLALLCEVCHQFVHSRRNTEMEYLKKGES